MHLQNVQTPRKGLTAIRSRKYGAFADNGDVAAGGGRFFVSSWQIFGSCPQTK
jgi:hypothetical protein